MADSTTESKKRLTAGKSDTIPATAPALGAEPDRHGLQWFHQGPTARCGQHHDSAGERHWRCSMPIAMLWN